MRDATAARKQHILSVKGTTVQPTVRSQLHTLHAHPGGGHFLSANKLWCYPLHVFFFSYRKLNVSTAPTLLFFKPPVASQLYRVDAYNWSIACLTKNSFQPNATHPQVFTMERSSNLVWIKCLLLLKVRFLDTQPPLPPFLPNVPNNLKPHPSGFIPASEDSTLFFWLPERNMGGTVKGGKHKCTHVSLTCVE